MHRSTILVLLLFIPFTAARVCAEEPDGLRGWTEEARKAQRACEAALNAVPTPARLRAWHDLFCEEAHPAGTDGDQRTIAKMVRAFREMGLETDRHDFWAYLPKFDEARVDVQHGDRVIALPLLEAAVAEDASVRDTVPAAFNAYSASGDVRAGVVYANYGTKEDFEKLKELGVSVKGRVVIARYGRNYRGYKAKYAEEHGAVGAVLYTDPDDSGYRKGIPYPEGGYANETYIQRGSIKTLAYPGDPLTPFHPATKDAERLDPETIALPRIPVQPVGWKAAHEILSRMDGKAVPKGWQGGLPFAYRLTGGADLKVRVMVKQTRRVVPSANVIGMVKGAKHPEQWVVVGCHLDAWTFGAGDPHAGSIVMFEMARSFAEAAKAGRRPARTVVFANWGAEEFGIIGSTEWCEANRDGLAKNGVAYINLDMAAMGPNFRSAAAPLLKGVIEDATRAVPQARAPGKTVHQAWTAKTDGKAKFGNLGGGSDHIGFYCHLGVPSCSLGAGGSQGVSYHSAYDTLAWYRKVVGEDYEPALMLARVGNVLVSRLANAPLIPYDIARPARDLDEHMGALKKHPGAADAQDLFVSGEIATRLAALAAGTQARLETMSAAGELSDAAHREVNTLLLGFERLWLRESGLPGRPWYRSTYAASDPFSGYASWMLPLLRHALEDPGSIDLRDALLHYAEVARGYTTQVRKIVTLLQAAKKLRAAESGK